MPEQRIPEGPAVLVEDLTKRYSGTRALDGASLSVAPGEIFGLLGPNGAGKSTMIRILTGRARPSGGLAQVLGHEMPRGLESVRREINAVAEVPNVYGRLSARANLDLFCKLYGLPTSRSREVLEQVRLGDVAAQKAGTFSTGMRQRLLLARALLNGPRVLFLDEPTRGLDPQSARELHEIVTDLAARGSTVFLTTHDMTEADDLCHRIAFLARGRIVALDTPRALKLSLGTTAPDASIVLDDGSEISMKLDGREDGRRLEELISAGRIRSMHSIEPTLADVFIQLAGQRLDHGPDLEPIR